MIGHLIIDGLQPVSQIRDPEKNKVSIAAEECRTINAHHRPAVTEPGRNQLPAQPFVLRGKDLKIFLISLREAM